MSLDELFDENISCDNIWFLSLLLLTALNNDKKQGINISIYINGIKAGDE